MNKNLSTLSNNRGTSLLEIMIALVLTGVVTAAIFQTYITQHKNYVAQDDVTEIQQTARATIDQLSRQIRMSGYNVPAGVDAIVASNTNPDSITVTYRPNAAKATVSATMASAGADIHTTDTIGEFSIGQWAYIFHPDSGGGEWFQITGLNSSSSPRRISHTVALSKAYVVNAQVVPMNQVTFYVDTTNQSRPNLMMRPRGQAATPYAENISGLQFRYRITSGAILDVPPLISDVREVLIDVTGRSRHSGHDQDSSDYRYRTYSSSVALRNMI